MIFPKTGASFVAFFALASAQESNTGSSCTPYSLPNPIWKSYPGNVTGTINATMAILPIPYELARSIVPKQYGILRDAWSSFLPDLPKDMYPALFQSVLDHDVRFGDYQLADFSRVSIEFPFIDLLGDGHTSFRWAPSMLLTSTNDMAIHGAREYGTNVYPSSFEPTCNAYEYQPNSRDTTYFRARSVSSKSKKDRAEVESIFSSNVTTKAVTFPINFFVNATNQPSFADGTTCDHYIRLYNTSLSTGSHAAVPVSGSIKARFHDLFGDKEMAWSDAVGVQIDTAFIENHMVSCQGLAGYGGVGEQRVEVKGEEWGWALSFAPLGANIQQVLTDYLVQPIKRAVL